MALEVPPFYVAFHKSHFSSMMARRILPEKGVGVYAYVTRHRHVEKLLVLKRLHPDLHVPEEQKELVSAIEELSQRQFEEFIRFLGIEEFIRSVKKLEEKWRYGGNGMWYQPLGLSTLYMILIIGDGRWTVRPAISKESMKGYGFEIPVDARLIESFVKELMEGEIEEIHDHADTHHFHLAMDSLERYMSLVRRWDYYFSTNSMWRQIIFLVTDDLIGCSAYVGSPR